jgi:hypothetical protein
MLSLATHTLWSDEQVPHIVLLGDSVFDNGAYVGGGPNVVEQVRMLFGAGVATLCAKDGAMISDIAGQLDDVPPGATHLVISVGGNDALSEVSIFDMPAGSVGDALDRLGNIQSRFRRQYAAMLDLVSALKLPMAVCTIYDPRYPNELQRKLGSTALSLLNDSITRECFVRRIDLLDLRVMFGDDGDFANPIEPSVQGGMKLADGIQRFVDGARGEARVIC